MADDMERMFDDFGFRRHMAPVTGPSLDRDFWRASADLNRFWSPPIEVRQQGEKLVVRADLPGLRKEDVTVDLQDGILAISGQREQDETDERDGYYRTERSYGHFYRTIALPEGIEPESCDASFKDGVLEVTLKAPKEPEQKARRIPVK
jgi:HSP20 family protein